MNMSAVPTIDFEPFMRGNLDDRRTVAKAIDRACIEIGFFAITGHGVPETKISELRAEAIKFFALPDSEKALVARPPEKISRGWNHIGDRSLAFSMGKETPPDLQESFVMGPVGVPDEPYFTCDRARPFFAPNLWPESRPELRAAMTEHFGAMEVLARALMQAFAMALDLPMEHFDDKIGRHASTLRLIRYPGRVDAATGQRRAGEHTDYGTLTILRCDNLPGGLQVKLRHGDWTDIVRPEGGFICNLGDAMARWTNDRWVSTLHRVGLPPSGAPTEDRYSIVFFHNPDYDSEIRCITAAGEGAKYPTESFDAYYLDKVMRGSFGKSGYASRDADIGTGHAAGSTSAP